MRKRRDTGDTEGPATGAVRELGAGQGRKSGDKCTRGDGRYRHAVRGAKTSVRGYQVAGVGNSQVNDVLRLYRRWGEGMTEK